MPAVCGRGLPVLGSPAEFAETVRSGVGCSADVWANQVEKVFENFDSVDTNGDGQIDRVGARMPAMMHLRVLV